MRQNWNNLLDYIKRNMGTNINLLELSDEEIIKGLKDDVLPQFSQYVPLKKYCKITSENRVNSDVGSNLMYKIPTNDYIIDVFDVFSTHHSNMSGLDDPYYDTKYAMDYTYHGGDYFGLIDNVINNNYNDIAKFEGVRLTHQFIPPDILEFSKPLIGGIVEYHTIHENLSTIRPDMYHEALKPFCLGSVQLWLSRIRSKYGELSTAIGTIRLNWEKLEQDAKENMDKAKDIFERLPPDALVHVSV